MPTRHFLSSDFIKQKNDSMPIYVSDVARAT